MDINRGTITRRMDSVLDDLEKEFKSMYTKHDFYQVLDKLEKAGDQSNRPSLLKKLFDMFDACNVKYEKGQDNTYYSRLIKELDIPDNYKGLEEKMLFTLYQKYQEYPTPEEYLNRIVNRLMSKDDHWETDTLRVKILKQFVKYGDCLTYKTGDGLKGAKPNKIVIYGGEKYISKYLKEKTGKKTIDLIEAVNDIDDDIFLVLNDATKEQKKPNGKYGLLKMVNDMANAQFRAEGATKKSLYLLAIVYGMTYYTGDDSDIINYATDIEINLFRDYYANNLMRFISDSYQGHLNEFELDPSGQGINYKNFAEMIYLFYISRNDYTPQQKIKLSDEMITRVQRQGKGKDIPSDKKAEGTEFFRRKVKNDGIEDMFSEDILNYSESEFEQYLCDYYDCNTIEGNNVLSPINLRTEQNTAYMVYKSVVEDLNALEGEAQDVYNVYASYDKELKYLKDSSQVFRYGLWITDVKMMGGDHEETFVDKLGVDKEKYTKFMDLLTNVNKFMQDTTERTKDTITRAAIIVEYYYYFNAYYDMHGSVNQKSFEEVFHEFKNGVDKKLDDAYYQPLNSKNIFDVLVAFSAYAYMQT